MHLFYIKRRKYCTFDIREFTERNISRIVQKYNLNYFAISIFVDLDIKENNVVVLRKASNNFFLDYYIFKQTSRLFFETEVRLNDKLIKKPAKSPYDIENTKNTKKRIFTLVAYNSISDITFVVMGDNVISLWNKKGFVSNLPSNLDYTRYYKLGPLAGLLDGRRKNGRIVSISTSRQYTAIIDIEYIFVITELKSLKLYAKLDTRHTFLHGGICKGSSYVMTKVQFSMDTIDRP